MKRSIFQVLVLVTLCFPAFADVNVTASGIHLGMPAKDVVEVLGQPLAIEEHPGRYAVPAYHSYTYLGLEGKSYEVCLQKGLVVAVRGAGCEIALNGTSLGTISTLSEAESLLKAFRKECQYNLDDGFLLTGWEVHGGAHLTCISESDTIKRWVLERP